MQARKHLDLVKKKYRDREYLDNVIDYVYSCLAEDKTFTSAELESLLAAYKNIAYSKFSAGYYHIYYYLLLVENARVQNRYGEALYYSEMADNEIIAYGDVFAYTASVYKAIFYNSAKQYKRAVAEYEKGNNNADKVLAFKEPRRLNPTVYSQLMNLMKFTMQAYVGLKDTLNATRIYNQSLLVTSLKTVRDDTSSRNRLGITEDLLEIQFAYFHTLLGNKGKASEIVKKYGDFVKKAVSLELVDKGVFVMIWSMKMQYFQNTGHVDSVKYYVEKCRQASTDHGYYLDRQEYLEPEYDAFVALHDFKEACRIGKELTQEYKDRLGQSLSSQLDLMYTDIQLEKNKSQLDKLRSEKRKRELMIWAIALLFLSTLSLVLFCMRLNRKKARQAIEDLAKISESQIARLKNENNLAIVNEQQRIGQDLHDGLAGSVAAIQQRLNFIRSDLKEPQLIDEIDDVRGHVEDVYKIVRNKSHQLFEHNKTFLDREYIEKIRTITTSALPGNRYALDLVIEDDAVAATPINYREIVIYILMECLTNVIKHAKATEVIVMLTKGIQGIILQVSDNGKGMTDTKKGKASAIGFGSIAKRVSSIDGELDIRTGTDGTTVVVRFP